VTDYGKLVNGQRAGALSEFVYVRVVDEAIEFGRFEVEDGHVVDDQIVNEGWLCHGVDCASSGRICES